MPPADPQLDELFQGPLDSFTKRRNELARNLQGLGDGSSAESVRALGKPSLAAWAVNQLWFNQRDTFDAFLATAEQLKSAQENGRDLADLVQKRRDLQSELNRAARTMLSSAGHAQGAATLQRIDRSLDAVIAFGGQQPDPPLGRLSRELQATGFGAFAGVTPAATGPRQAPPRNKRDPAERRRLEVKLREAEQISERATREFRQAKVDEGKARVTLNTAHKDLERAREQVVLAEQRLAGAEADVQRAIDAAAEAAKTAATGQTLLEQARQLLKEP